MKYFSNSSDSEVKPRKTRATKKKKDESDWSDTSSDDEKVKKEELQNPKKSNADARILEDGSIEICFQTDKKVFLENVNDFNRKKSRAM